MFETILEKAAGAVSVGAHAISKGAETVSKGASAVKKAQEEAWIVSEDSPFVASGLEIYPSRIKYKDTICSFDEIENLGWHWTSKTVNGLINTQEVKLTIFIKNKKNISIDKTTMYVKPKLVHGVRINKGTKLPMWFYSLILIHSYRFIAYIKRVYNFIAIL